MEFTVIPVIPVTRIKMVNKLPRLSDRINPSSPNYFRLQKMIEEWADVYNKMGIDQKNTSDTFVGNVLRAIFELEEYKK